MENHEFAFIFTRARAVVHLRLVNSFSEWMSVDVQCLVQVTNIKNTTEDQVYSVQVLSYFLALRIAYVFATRRRCLHIYVNHLYTLMFNNFLPLQHNSNIEQIHHNLLTHIFCATVLRYK